MINKLSDDLKNKISAGEVVERPASVVKELIENSIDAGANIIKVIVQKGGQSLIQVKDDGFGISKSDLPNTVKRYHTSKLSEVEDLFHIKTLGFRGEALASVCAVSNLSIISNIQKEPGFELIYDIKLRNYSLKPAAQIDGTEVTVRNLFFNTPARKKFLKSIKTELRKIIDIVKSFGLSFPQIDFILNSEGKDIILVRSEILEERINSLFDNTYKDNLLPLNIEKNEYVFSGYIGNLNLLRKRPSEQYIFLNGRHIKDRLLSSAISSAYKSIINRGEFPFYIVNIKIPVNQVDVNVHPMKIEARFHDEWRVYQVLKSGASDAIKNILPTIPNFYDGGESFNSFFKKPTYNNDQSQSVFNFNDVSNGESKLDTAKSYALELANPNFSFSEAVSEKMWQIHKRYIISEINSGLVIIDQHVAHERVLYEEALKAFETTSLGSQALLFSEKLEFSRDQFDLLLDILPYLEKIGFKINKISELKIEVEAIPADVIWGSERKIIKDIIDEFLESGKNNTSYKESIAASFACKAAIKSGDSMTYEEMQMLINRLFATEHPYYCPHGRPIIIQMSIDELDKRFERI